MCIEAYIECWICNFFVLNSIYFTEQHIVRVLLNSAKYTLST